MLYLTPCRTRMKTLFFIMLIGLIVFKVIEIFYSVFKSNIITNCFSNQRGVLCWGGEGVKGDYQLLMINRNILFSTEARIILKLRPTI